HQSEHAGHESAHREADQHKPFRRLAEHPPRHAFQGVVLEDVAIVQRAEPLEIRHQVAPQVAVAQRTGQKAEVTHSGQDSNSHLRSVANRARASPSAMAPITKPTVTAACRPPSVSPRLNSTIDSKAAAPGTMMMMPGTVSAMRGSRSWT